MKILKATKSADMLKLIDDFVPPKFQGKTLKKVRSIVQQAKAADEFILKDDSGHTLTLSINFPT